MPAEFLGEMRGLGLASQGQAGEGSGKRLHNRRFIEWRKLQFRHRRAYQVYARDELFQFVIEQGKLKEALAISLGEAAARRRRFDFALVLVMDHQVPESHQPDG